MHKRVGKKILSGPTGTHLKSRAEEILAEKIKEAKQEALQPPVSNSNETFDPLLARYKFRIASEGLSAKTVKKRNAMISSVLKTWTEVPEFSAKNMTNLKELRPRDISYDDLLAWRNHYQKERGPDYTNKTVSMLREIFDIAIEEKTIYHNPVARLKWVKVPKKKLVMPSQEQFESFLHHLTHLHPCQAKTNAGHAKDYVEGIAFTGLRKEEAELLRVAHVDLVNWILDLPAEIVKGRKRARIVPIIAEARPLFERLVKNADPVTGIIFKVGKRLHSLKKASILAGLPIIITTHKLRHFFATTWMECTNDAQGLAETLGHGDRGKLALDTYSHVRRPKVIASSEKVKFRTTEPS